MKLAALLVMTGVLWTAAGQPPPPIRWLRYALERATENPGPPPTNPDEAERRREFWKRWDSFATLMNACGDGIAHEKADRPGCAAAAKAFEHLTAHEGWPGGRAVRVK